MANEQPHDRLIKETLSNIREAVLFFKKFLPSHIDSNLDYDTLKLEDKTFLNEAGRETYSDLLFSCNWKDGDKKVMLHFLVEHKSTPEQRPHLQIGGYLAEGYATQVKQQRQEKINEPLIPIIPLLLYHGEETWGPGKYESYFDLPDLALASYLPSFDLLMIDLAKFTDEQIMELGQCFLTSTLLIFKHKNDRGYVLANLGKIFIFAEASGSNETLSRFFRVFVLYLFRALRFERKEIDKMVESLPKKNQPMFESTYDMLIKEGEIIGLQKGEAIGLQKGEAIGLQKGEAIGLQKGEAIGLQKGELMRSLEIVLDGILYMPSLDDTAIAKLAKQPEYFVAAMRSFFQNNQLAKAKRAASDLFFDLPGMAQSDFEKINQIVETAWEKRATG